MSGHWFPFQQGEALHSMHCIVTCVITILWEFLLVQILVEMPADTPEEILVVFILAVCRHCTYTGPPHHLIAFFILGVYKPFTKIVKIYTLLLKFPAK